MKRLLIFSNLMLFSYSIFAGPSFDGSNFVDEVLDSVIYTGTEEGPSDEEVVNAIEYLRTQRDSGFLNVRDIMEIEGYDIVKAGLGVSVVGITLEVAGGSLMIIGKNRLSEATWQIIYDQVVWKGGPNNPAFANSMLAKGISRSSNKDIPRVLKIGAFSNRIGRVLLPAGVLGGLSGGALFTLFFPTDTAGAEASRTHIDVMLDSLEGFHFVLDESNANILAAVKEDPNFGTVLIDLADMINSQKQLFNEVQEI